MELQSKLKAAQAGEHLAAQQVCLIFFCVQTKHAPAKEFLMCGDGWYLVMPSSFSLWSSPTYLILAADIIHFIGCYGPYRKESSEGKCPDSNCLV